jgi:protein involved in polysaccharide export with SLBB domain
VFLRIKIIGLFSFFLLNIFLQSSILGQTSAVEAPSEPDKSAADLIHFGDLIDVDIVGSVEFDWRGTITPEGFLSGLDYIEEPVYALCRSEEAVAEEIAKGYSKLLRDPKVKVKILDRSNRPTTVIYGAVKTEQKFQIKRPIYLNELIVFAGGFTEKASGTIQIFRPANLSCNVKKNENDASTTSEDSKKMFVPASQPGGANNIDIKISELLKGEKSANPQILSGDIITVLAADPIYVIGGVNAPKQIASRSETTLTRAIAGAGGLAKDADAKTVTIFRRNGRDTKIIEADYEKIDSGQVDDIILLPFDVVEVAVKGRGKSKYPPVVRVNNADGKNSANLPLRIID